MKQLTPRQINAQRKKDGKPPLNFALIRKIIKQIETAPDSYDQSTFGAKSEIAPCGTAACIAGWATVLDGRVPHTQIRRLNNIASRYGQKALGIFDAESNLFSALPQHDWPAPFNHQWRNTGWSDRKRARVAVRYLKHILKTGQII